MCLFKKKKTLFNSENQADSAPSHSSCIHEYIQHWQTFGDFFGKTSQVFAHETFEFYVHFTWALKKSHNKCFLPGRVWRIVNVPKWVHFFNAPGKTHGTSTAAGKGNVNCSTWRWLMAMFWDKDSQWHQACHHLGWSFHQRADLHYLWLC